MMVEFTDGVGRKKIEPVAVSSEASYYRITQCISRDFPGASDIRVVEDVWKKPTGKKNRPEYNHLSVAFIDEAGQCRVLLAGWKTEDVAEIVSKNWYWSHVDLPNVPSEMEGNPVD